MILKPKKIKSVTVSIVSPSICHEVMGPDAMILVFSLLSFKLTDMVRNPQIHCLRTKEEISTCHRD